MQWPGFDQAEWRRVHAAAVKQERDAVPLIRGSDQTERAVRAAKENATRAGVADLVAFERADALKIDPGEEPGWVVSNPPYGVRLGDERQSRDLLFEFGERLRQAYAGWRYALLAPGDVRGIPGIKPTSIIKTTNGGLRVQVVVGGVPEKR